MGRLLNSFVPFLICNDDHIKPFQKEDFLKGLAIYFNSDYNGEKVWGKLYENFGSTNVYKVNNFDNDNRQNQNKKAIIFFTAPFLRYYVYQNFIQNNMQNHYDIFVIDFGDPEYGETNFGIDEYINYVYVPIINHIKRDYKKTICMGHCFAGTILMWAIALGKISPDAICIINMPISKNDIKIIKNQNIKILKEILKKTREKIVDKFLISGYFASLFKDAFINKFIKLANDFDANKNLNNFIKNEDNLNTYRNVQTKFVMDILDKVYEKDKLVYDLQNNKIKLPILNIQYNNDRLVTRNLLSNFCKNTENIILDGGHMSPLLSNDKQRILAKKIQAWLGGIVV